MSSDKQVVFITGGNTGLGLETAKALYQSGGFYNIIIGSRSSLKGEVAIGLVEKEFGVSGSSLSTVAVDLTSDESIEKAIQMIGTTYGRLDVLVNNAGANFDSDVKRGGMSLREASNASWDLNVSGAHVLTATAVPLLLQSTDPRLLFITSGTASIAESEYTDSAVFQRINGALGRGWPKPLEANPITLYRSSKAGLNMIMRDWCRVLGNDGVKIWSISPGFLATGLSGFGADTLKKMGAVDPSEGGMFIKDVVEGKRDKDVGKAIRADMVQPWVVAFSYFST